MRIAVLVLSCWVVGSFALVASVIAVISLSRALHRRLHPRRVLPDDVVAGLEEVYARTRAVERTRALGYLRGLRARQVRLTTVGLRRPGDRGDQLVFGDGTSIHLLPGGGEGIGELLAAVTVGGVVALAAVEPTAHGVSFTFRRGGELLRVSSADLAVL